MIDLDELFANQALELRRGTIVLATLSMLNRPLYGYSLLQILEEAGIPVDAGTLYPLLRRYEKEGVLQSSWDTSDIHPRKFYQLSPKGQTLYARLADEWLQTSEKLRQILSNNRESKL